MSSKPTAIVPDATSRMECRVVDPPHPAVVDGGRLLAGCELRTQRRSGPGGQHRNKTSSGAFLTHRATGIVGEATERRSQAQNRDVALMRLRYLLAIEIRTPSPLDPTAWTANPEEDAIRRRYANHSLRLNDANDDKPAVLALVLNDLWVAGGQPSLLAPSWSVSTSKIVSLIRSYGPALAWVNRVRSHHQRLPLH
ncbi:Peptide chain release factor 1 [Stieleria maiorica]|uniref:Peptide chain release factor 1 n=1 Tax=Stieleria maiorica TaxID=2795974 RepID=A0A5B9MA16_9BACT|nr:peptide chain release factor-like protein [Stieleria maiorica]QEF96067.1 Peptide chain release factor 1 [Stieleria maiorica]